MKQVSIGLVCLVFLFFSVACTKRVEDTRAGSVRIVMPSQQMLQSAGLSQPKASEKTMIARSFALSTPSWGQSDPTTNADVNCFVVFYEGTEPENRRNTCVDLSGTTVATPGAWFGGYGPGEAAEITVPSGPSRKISVVGFKSADAVSCLTMKAQLDNSKFSAPRILGSVTQTLQPGDNNLTIVISLQNSVVFSDCSGPDFKSTVSPGLPTTTTSLVWDVQPGGGAAGQAWSQQGKVRIIDSSGNTVTTGPDASAPIQLSLYQGTGVLSGTVVVNAVDGVADFSGKGLSIELAGTDKILRATKADTLASGGSIAVSANSNAFTITSGPATALAFARQPGGGAAGASWSQQPQVRAVDSFGNIVTSFTNTVSLAIQANPGSGTLSGTTSVTAVSGLANFSGLSIDKVGGTYTLTASASGLGSISSNSFAITPAAMNTITVTGVPGSATAGTLFNITVTALDAFGNTATGYAGTVQFSSSDSNSPVLPADFTYTSGDQGTHTFPITLNTAGSQTVTVSQSGGGPSVASSSISVSAGAATTLVFTTQPGGGQAAAVWAQQPVVKIFDSFNNLVTSGPDSTQTVTLSLISGSGTLSGTTSVAAVSGVATFSGLSLNAIGAGKQLMAITILTSGTQTATSSAFSIGAGAATHLAFSAQPSNSVRNTTISTITVEARDAGENVVTSFNGTVSLSIGTNPTSGTLFGTVSGNAVSGSRSFSDLSINKDGVGYTLVATAAGLSGATSASFNILLAPLSITPGSYTMPGNSFKVFSVAGGKGPYSFQLISGPGTLMADGVFLSNATPGATVLRVTDSAAHSVDTSITTASPGTYQLVAVGKHFVHPYSCALTPDQHIKCWGDNDYGQHGTGNSIMHGTPVLVDGATTYSVLSVGGLHTCGITTAGVLKCWGYNWNYQVGDGTQATRYSPVVIDSGTLYADVFAGIDHTCAITQGGDLKCWGKNNYGQVGDGTTVDVHTPVVIDAGTYYATGAAGDGHTCAVTTVGGLKCWGLNASGQLGIGSTVNQLTPVTPSLGGPVSAVTLGASHSCALLSDSTLKCWGANTYGQVGDVSNTMRTSPVLINSGIAYSKVSAGVQHTCGILASGGGLKCWGQNSGGQLGDSTTTNRNAPYVIDSGTAYVSVSGGVGHTCGVTTAGVAKCWGTNSSSQLGNGSTVVEPRPLFADMSTTYSKVGVGVSHNCAITTSGALKCWGDNSVSQLGTGTVVNQNLPTVIDSGVIYTQFSAGGSTSCGITNAGALKCWGGNSYGTIGDGTTTGHSTPIVIDTGVTYSKVSVGFSHTCAITTAGDLKCWGQNLNGEVGDGTATNRLAPVVIDSGTTYAEIATAYAHTCGITTAGVMKCWGKNDSGQLGLGNTLGQNQPTVVDLGTAYIKVAVGGNSVHPFSCGITTSNELRCWGGNGFGQLGVGDSTQRLVPSVVDAGTKYIDVDGDYGIHTCAITNAGVLKCWGYNSWGQVGDGTLAGYNVPHVIDPGTTYARVSTGDKHTCGITTEAEMKCWGESLTGKLGFGRFSEFVLQPNMPVMD